MRSRSTDIIVLVLAVVLVSLLLIYNEPRTKLGQGYRTLVADRSGLNSNPIVQTTISLPQGEEDSQSYIYGGPALLYTSSSEISFSHSDYIRSLRISTKESGVRNLEINFLPAGQILSSASEPNGQQRLQYTNKEHDSSSDLMYFGARYYNQQTGRFSQTDPVLGGLTYAYANNNPLLYMDPSGNFPTITDLNLQELVRQGRDIVQGTRFLMSMVSQHPEVVPEALGAAATLEATSSVWTWSRIGSVGALTTVLLMATPGTAEAPTIQTETSTHTNDLNWMESMRDPENRFFPREDENKRGGGCYYICATIEEVQSWYTYFGGSITEQEHFGPFAVHPTVGGAIAARFPKRLEFNYEEVGRIPLVILRLENKVSPRVEKNEQNYWLRGTLTIANTDQSLSLIERVGLFPSDIHPASRPYLVNALKSKLRGQFEK